METSHMQSLVEIKSSRNGEIIHSITDIGKSCHSHEFLILLTLFTKINSCENFLIYSINAL